MYLRKKERKGKEERGKMAEINLLKKAKKR